MVFSSLGMTTCSSALTRRFVILMTSSRMTNAVCARRGGGEVRPESSRHEAAEGRGGKGEGTHLERGELDEGLDGLGERLAAASDLLTAATKTGEAECCGRARGREGRAGEEEGASGGSRRGRGRGVSREGRGER